MTQSLSRQLWILIAMLCVSLSALAYDFEIQFEDRQLQFTILSHEDQTVSVVGGTTGYIPCEVTYNNKTYTVTEIGTNAFYHNDNYRYIGRIVLPISLKAIRSGAFRKCIAPYIAIPDGVETIESNAFNSRSLETIVIGSGIKKMESGAINNECVYLKTIVFRSPEAPKYGWTHIAASAPEEIGNQNTTIIVPQVQGYDSIAKYAKGTMIEPVSFKQHQYEYSGKIPALEYIKNISSASTQNMVLKNKDAGKYEQSFFVDLQGLLPYYYFHDYNGSMIAPDRGIDVPFKYSITKKPLVVKIDNQQRIYGEPNPSTFTYSISGFIEGEDETQLASPIICETTASLQSPVGNYPITCNPSALNYSFEIQQGFLNIKKAPLSIYAKNTQRPYGEVNPVFSCSYSGFKLEDDESTAFSSLPNFSCAATKTSDVGEYPIAVSGGTAGNYEIVSYENGTLNVTKAPLVLVATDKSRLYFEDNPQFTYTLTGLRNSDTKNCLSIQPTFKCSAVKTSNAGDYIIEPLNAMAHNYAIDYQNGTLSVNQRPLTATIGNYTRIYGTENPQFEIEYFGFVNNDDKSDLTETPNINCQANPSSDVGIYPISMNGGQAQNYVINKYNSGTLTIEKAEQMITWNQDLSNIQKYSQVTLEATSNSGLSVSYDMSPNNVATLYNNNGTWYLDCYGIGAVNIRAIQNGDKNHNAASIVSKTLVVIGNGGDPSDPQIFLNVEKAGTLPSLIADNRKYQIKNLCLTGYLNGTDINFLREMSGCDSNGNGTPGVLETLDISRCTIVSGGISYYKSNQTSNNRVSDYMFYNCNKLVHLQLPDDTSLIGDYAFADCDRLSVISMPNSVTSLGKYSFRNDISLIRIPISNSLKYIKDFAFIGCNGISELTIPASVISIGNEIVKDCQNIAIINVANGSDYFASHNGVLYTSNYRELLIFPVNYESNSYSVLDGTEKIAPNAFVSSKKLSALILPPTLSSIGSDAFIGCVNLSSLQVKALTPPKCDNDCFEAVSKARCELVVPKGCYSYYWVAPVWSEFNKISESDFISNIGCTSVKKIEVSVDNGCIVIKGAPDGDKLYIYDSKGVLVFVSASNGDDMVYTPSERGVYIVVGAGQTTKVVVR